MRHGTGPRIEVAMSLTVTPVVDQGEKANDVSGGRSAEIHVTDHL